MYPLWFCHKVDRRYEPKKHATRTSQKPHGPSLITINERNEFKFTLP